MIELSDDVLTFPDTDPVGPPYVEFLERPFRLRWVRLGEGLWGEYNPEDPDDVELLRFELMKPDGQQGWEYVKNGGYCTQFKVASPRVVQRAGLWVLAEKLGEDLIDDRQVRRTFEEASHIHHCDKPVVEKTVRLKPNDPEQVARWFIQESLSAGLTFLLELHRQGQTIPREALRDGIQQFLQSDDPQIRKRAFHLVSLIENLPDPPESQPRSR